LCAVRTTRVFCTDETRIRTEYTGIDKAEYSAKFCFVQDRSLQLDVSSAATGANDGHCALRAPTVFSVRMKSVSAQKTRFWVKTETA